MIDFSDPLFSATSKKRKVRRGRVHPAPERSSRVYIYINPSQVHLFRFYLEAHDNLGIMTVVDRWRAALMLRYSPYEEKRIAAFLTALPESLSLSVAIVPGRGADILRYIGDMPSVPKGMLPLENPHKGIESP